MVEGVDYSYQRPDPKRLYNSGKRFACRYVSYDTTGKNITKTEAKALIAAGVAPVTNWENSLHDMLGGYSVGVQHAQEANRLHLAASGPADRPIYFGVDFDASPAQLVTCFEYVRGAASVIGWGRVGVYGGIKTMAYMADRGVRWLWQTYAWSYGAWDPRAQLQQYNNTEPVAGQLLDLCRSTAADYGQWTISMPPDDTPPPSLIEDIIDLRRDESAGEPVKALQGLLGRAGFPCPITGVYDADTSASLLAARKSQGSYAENGDHLIGVAYGQLMAALIKNLTQGAA
jgi:hypothetical protein